MKSSMPSFVEGNRAIRMEYVFVPVTWAFTSAPYRSSRSISGSVLFSAFAAAGPPRPPVPAPAAAINGVTPMALMLGEAPLARRACATSAVTILDDETYDDIDIGDDNNQNALAYTQVWTSVDISNYPPACSREYDSCGVCRNENVTIYSTVRLSPTNLAAAQRDYSYWSYDQWVIHYSPRNGSRL